LREADADDELLVLAVPQLSEAVPQAHDLRRGPPGLCQRADQEWAGALRRARAADEQPRGGRDQQKEEAAYERARSQLAGHGRTGRVKS
jgi:hypothetical protein